jgi:hypothetical protein
VRATSILLTISLLDGCYLAHERGAPMDAGLRDAVVDDVAADAVLADVGCFARPPATIRFEPPIMPALDIRVVLLGFEDDPAANGVRFHLDVCGGSPPCVVDLIVSNVGDALAGTPMPSTAPVSGTLSVDDALTTAAFSVTGTGMCATCGGRLDVLAGALRPGFGGAQWVAAYPMAICSDGCTDEFWTVFVDGMDELAARAGTPADLAPLHARLATDARSSCARCDCTTPIQPSTGIAFVSTPF